MTREYDGHYRNKHPLGTTPDDKITEAVQARSPEGKLTCAHAFEIAHKLSVPPMDVGRTADLLEIRISQCQLGLFGYEPQKRIVRPLHLFDAALKKAIQEGLLNGRLPCTTAFKIAKQFGLTKLTVSSACETLGIKISSCQLGAF